MRRRKWRKRNRREMEKDFRWLKKGKGKKTVGAERGKTRKTEE